MGRPRKRKEANEDPELDLAEYSLEDLERIALQALVRKAAKGDNSAANAALLAVERIRKGRLADKHRARMLELAKDPIGLARYMGELGQTEEQAAKELGRKLRPAERVAWADGVDARTLEVRAVELERMRRGDRQIPKWATRGNRKGGG